MTKVDLLEVSGWLEGLTPLNYHRVMKLIEKLVRENQKLTPETEPAQQGIGDPGLFPQEPPAKAKELPEWIKKVRDAQEAQRKIQSPKRDCWTLEGHPNVIPMLVQR